MGVLDGKDPERPERTNGRSFVGAESGRTAAHHSSPSTLATRCVSATPPPLATPFEVRCRGRLRVPIPLQSCHRRRIAGFSHHRRASTRACMRLGHTAASSSPGYRGLPSSSRLHRSCCGWTDGKPSPFPVRFLPVACQLYANPPMTPPSAAVSIPPPFGPRRARRRWCLVTAVGVGGHGGSPASAARPRRSGAAHSVFKRRLEQKLRSSFGREIRTEVFWE